jgi:hypothetical protein
MKLTRIERRWARAVCETIFPSPSQGGTLPLGIADMDLDGFLDETLAAIPVEPAVGLRLAFFLLAFAPLFVIGRFATLPSLGTEDRQRVLLAVASSKSYAIRSTIVAVKAVVSLFYCGDGRLRPRIWSATAGAPQLVALKPREAARPKPQGAVHEQHA